MAFFRRPFDNSWFKTLNFLPYFGSNNFVINGTQIIPSDNTLRDHLILENFEEDDYQFKTKEFNSGFKIYYEDGNHLKQKYLLFESHAKLEKLYPPREKVTKKDKNKY